MFYPVLAILLGYLLGSLSFAVIISRIMGLSDPRTYGSKNPGATNVLRSGNRAAAALTLLLDAAKGWLAVMLAEWLGRPYGLQEGSMALTGLGGFSTAAGHIGPEIEVGHDISMFVPEIWCRLRPEERDPVAMIRDGMLEALQDREHNGVLVPVSRLGYRITSRFVRRYFGRVFDNPLKVFDEKILCPETQDLDSFLDGVLYVAEAQQRVAKVYFEDGSIANACPPLKALLEIMATGKWDGKTAQDPGFRQMFTRESVLQSDWYKARLVAKQDVDIRLAKRKLASLQGYCQQANHQQVIERLQLTERLKQARLDLDRYESAEYLQSLRGCIGVDPAL